MKAYLVVFLGAGVGGMMRHGINISVTRLLGLGFPFATLFVNVAGSLMMGVLTAYFAARTGLSQHLRLILTTGLLGGFTTFSAFSLDAALMIEREQYGLAAAYAAGSLVLAIAGFFAGMALVGATVRLS